MRNIQILIGLVTFVLILSGCSLTGNVVKTDFNRCVGGFEVSKVIKGETVDMCCFTSNFENRKIDSCNSYDSKYTETTITEGNVITQRKVVYPLNGMSCTNVYGRINEVDKLELIPELTVCSSNN
ncbi:hypothetical protein JXM83_04100 [Candidatus Woesearchaeota archaeon]|nr:hypothetical protein [Candidatus Woesearchaeota archaeon]